MQEDIEYGRTILDLEAAAVRDQAGLLQESFSRAVKMILECAGHVVTTGMGKSGIIAQKISATLASTGTPSFFLHPAEAVHGDLGRVGGDDVLLAISRSGATEVVRIIPSVKQIGARLIGMTAESGSELARHADCVLLLAQAPEACPIGLAPTTSTTAQLALGDALAMTVAKRRNFSREEFARFHPGGSLGRSLLRVREIMRTDRDCPAAPLGVPVREALQAAERTADGRRPGALVVVDGDGRLVGLLTDGDLRRNVLAHAHLLDRPVEEAMTANPTAIRAEQLAAEAWNTMQRERWDELPVVDEDGRYVGILDIQDLLAAGVTEGP